MISREISFVVFCLLIMASPLFAQDAKPTTTPAAEHFTADDWSAVVKTYEGQISDSRPTSTALHNLALARFKRAEMDQAICAWVAAWSIDPKDDEIISGLTAALTSLGLGMDSLNLAAHGPWQAWVASGGEARFMFFLKVAVGVLVVAGFLIFLSFTTSAFERFLSPSRVRWIRVMSLVLVTFLWAFVGLYKTSLGQWGAVVGEQAQPLRERAAVESLEVTRLKPGSPIYILGDTYAPFLYVKTSDGSAGWVDALGVRVIRY